MDKKIKLIWEYRGDDGHQTAVHYEHHLEEYIEAAQLKNHILGVEKINDLYSIAYMVIEQDELNKVRDALKPTRAEWYEEKP